MKRIQNLLNNLISFKEKKILENRKILLKNLFAFCYEFQLCYGDSLFMSYVVYLWLTDHLCKLVLFASLVVATH